MEEINDFLSSVLSLANIGVFFLVALFCAIQVSGGELEFLHSILIAAIAATSCGFIATLMVTKKHLERLS